MKTWLLMLCAVVISYGASVRYGFSQDDFFHLTISNADSLREFVSFFRLDSAQWVFYRPLSTQVWYWLFTSHLPYEQAVVLMHIASLLLHSINAYLIVLVLRKVFRLSPKSAVVAGVLYAVSSIHFLSLFYIGATQQLLVTFFALLALLANFTGKFALSSLFFLASLLSKEIALRFVPILLILRLVRGDHWREAIKSTLGPLVITLLYLIMRFTIGVNTPSEYSLDLSPLKAVASLMWYGLFSFGAPENLLSYGLSAGQIDWRAYIVNNAPYSLVNLIFILLSVVVIFLKRLNRDFFPAFILWITAISPVIFFPTHRYPHYLDLALIPIFGWVFSRKNTRLPKQIFAVAFLISALSGQLIDRQTHWTIGRSVLAKSYTNQIREAGVCQHQGILFEGSESELKEISYVLMNEHGPRHICNNPNLEVYYGSAPDSPGDDLAIIKLE